MNKASNIVVGTILLSLFALTAVLGLVTVYENEWCPPGVFCTEAWKVLRAANECAAIASVAAAGCALIVRTRLSKIRTSVLIMIALVISTILFFTFPIALEIRSILATQFFPYVISIRFGIIGMFIVWGTFSAVVCAAVMAAVLRIDNLTSRLRVDP